MTVSSVLTKIHMHGWRRRRQRCRQCVERTVRRQSLPSKTTLAKVLQEEANRQRSSVSLTPHDIALALEPSINPQPSLSPTPLVSAPATQARAPRFPVCSDKSLQKSGAKTRRQANSRPQSSKVRHKRGSKHPKGFRV